MIDLHTFHQTKNKWNKKYKIAEIETESLGFEQLFGQLLKDEDNPTALEGLLECFQNFVFVNSKEVVIKN